MSGLWMVAVQPCLPFVLDFSCILYFNVHIVLALYGEGVLMDMQEIETTILQRLLFDLFSLTREKKLHLVHNCPLRQTNGRSILTTCTNNEVVGAIPLCFAMFSPDFPCCLSRFCLFVCFVCSLV